MPTKSAWQSAGKHHLPLQTLFSQRFKLLIQATTAPPNQPIHHVVFSPGYLGFGGLGLRVIKIEPSTPNQDTEATLRGTGMH